MPYATRLDLEQRYGADEVAQREQALGTDAVDRVLGDADALIDGYLVGRYVLPLTPVPDRMVTAAAVIARYYLLGDAATDRARDDYRDEVAWLKDVAKGIVQLQAAAPEPGNDPSMVVMVAGAPAVFKRQGRP